MAQLGPKNLQKVLTRLGIPFSEDAGEAELRALWTLSHLELLDDTDTLLPKLKEIWGMSVQDQVKMLKREGLDATGNKWEHVKILVDLKFVTLIQMKKYRIANTSH